MRFGRWLFGLGCGLAALLVAAVLLAPFVAEAGASEERPRLITLFAQDRALRRTCLASAVGLLVTAFVFFRRGPHGPGAQPPRRPRRSHIAGA